MTGFAVSLPYPPSVNRLWRHVHTKGGCRTYKTDEARRFEATAFLLTKRAIMATERQMIPTPPYEVSIEVWRPDKRRRDIDNVVKAAIDAVFLAMGRDDAWVDRLTVWRGETWIDKTDPRCIVWVSGKDDAG